MTKDELKLLEFMYARLANYYDEREDLDYMIKFRELIEQQKHSVLRDRFVVVTETDIGADRWMESRGPIVHETYVGESTAGNALDRALKLGGKYGRVMICRLEPVGNEHEFGKMLEGES